MLTPTTIFAPGSLINPPDGSEDGRPDSPPFTGPGGALPGYGAPSGYGAQSGYGAPPGYAPFPGQEPWSAPGGFPPPGGFQQAAPGPGNAGFAGPGGYPPETPPDPGMFAGPGRFVEQGGYSGEAPFPGPGGYPAHGGPGGGTGYGAAEYPPVGYGVPGFEHPYPGHGGGAVPEGPGAASPGFPGGTGYVPQAGQRFPGPPMPGYAEVPGPDPWQQPPGWHAPDGYPPSGAARRPGGPPFHGAPGTTGAGSGSYPGPGGYPGQPGYPPGPGFAGQVGGPGPNPYPGQPGYPGPGGYPGSGEPQAPYAEYQGWRPQGGYPGPGGRRQTFDGGEYAYVIREDDVATPPPSGARLSGPGLGERSPASAGRTAGAGGPAGSGKPADTARTPTAAMRAITAGAVDEQRQAAAGASTETASSAATAAKPGPAAPEPPVPGHADPAEPANPAGPAVSASAGDKARAEADIDPAVAYGPDDPAYGPPGPDWYKRDEQQRTPWAEDGDSRDDEGKARPVRGPFEPLRPGERDALGYPGYEPAGKEPGLDDHDGLLADMPGFQPLDYEMPEVIDWETPSDPEAGPLGQLKDLYARAETVSPAGLDSQFDQLLERQRQLISEYFKESGGVVSVEAPPPVTSVTAATSAAPTAPPDPPASPVPLGFDTAKSLTGLRGELHGAP